MAGTTLPGVLLTGTHAARPAATAVGTGAVYSCTTHFLIYQTDGATWTTWGTLNAGAAPAVHATTHQTGGSDAIKIDDLAAGDDNTDLNTSTTKHGLTPKLSNVSTEYLSGTGIYSTPAGSGIPGTIVDVKGDLIAATAADTVARLAAGTNGLALVAASGETTGLKWGIPNRHGCLVYFGGATQVVNNTFIPFNTEIYDTDAYHDTVTNNHRITIPAGLGGLYLMEFGGYAASAAAGEVMRVELNGTTNISLNFGENEDDFIAGQCVYPLVAADYVWVAFYGNRTLGHASAYERQPHFSATLLGA